MASLKDIKRKVGAVQKTKQITRAMNMVAASKFKSAQVRMENFRPYAGQVHGCAQQPGASRGKHIIRFLPSAIPERIRVICMTSDRGLCGGFNTNLIKATERFMKEKVKDGKDVSLVVVGRKARDYFRKKARCFGAKGGCFQQVRYDAGDIYCR